MIADVEPMQEDDPRLPADDKLYDDSLRFMKQHHELSSGPWLIPLAKYAIHINVP